MSFSLAGYQSLVGATDSSWGWDLGRNKIYHDSKNNEGITYPSILNDADLNSTFMVPDKFKGQWGCQGQGVEVTASRDAAGVSCSGRER